MRLKKRLPILWKFFKSKKKFKMYLRDIVQLESKNEIEHYSGIFYKYFYDFKKFHKENSDLRFSQVLHANMLHKEGFWYYKEDDVILIELGLNPNEILFWGANFDINNKRLKKTKWILIKDLKTDHIQSILDGNFTNNQMYLKAFRDEIKYRKSNN